MDNVTIISSGKNWMEQTAVEQLPKIAALPGVVKAVGLPDLHTGKTPVGAVIITENMIYPHLIGNDIGCGMSLFSTEMAIPWLMAPVGNGSGLSAKRVWKASIPTKKTIRVTKFRGRVVCNEPNLLFEEAPESNKNIDTVMQSLVELGLLKVIYRYFEIYFDV